MLHIEGGIYLVRHFPYLQNKYNSFLLNLIILKYNYIGEDCKSLAIKSLNNSWMGLIACHCLLFYGDQSEKAKEADIP